MVEEKARYLLLELRERAVQWHARRITRWRYEQQYHFPDENGIHPKGWSFKEEVKWCKADTRKAMLKLIDEIEDQK